MLPDQDFSRCQRNILYRCLPYVFQQILRPYSLGLAAVTFPAAWHLSNIALPVASLVPISPTNPPTFGFHPVTELVTSPSAAQEEAFPFSMYPENPPARPVACNNINFCNAIFESTHCSWISFLCISHKASDCP